jgi:uncharacterized protein (DUF2225 family)
MTDEVKDARLSYLAKEEIKCPCCGNVFHKEVLRSGSGRLIADELTDELHRLYKPSQKYGEVYPLAYSATVCPQCWFASQEEDFALLPQEYILTARGDEQKRRDEVDEIFPDVDFDESRNLMNGAASLLLVLHCYDDYPPEDSPTIKQGIAALRCGWLLDALAKEYPGEHYDWLAVLFKRKAQFLYEQALTNESGGTENLNACKNFGPDTDKNYGYEGALYVSGVLLLKYGQRDNVDIRKAALEKAKIAISKVFGIGKTSKGRPGPLLENVKAIYNRMNAELGEND